ncbi:hypothetical protein BLA29_012470 [Euroglyphus maynei]|uniref:Uncharacterized protein n=1 Tax=Euroglyphus maynei TaxID=6958 RepID=A0A1Y3AYK1_EURMA|nr:hypothetical protein BLA29_012470 [Euroglyphus maynei]
MAPKKRTAKSANDSIKSTKKSRKQKQSSNLSSDSDLGSDNENFNNNGNNDTTVEETSTVSSDWCIKPDDLVGRLIVSGGTNWDLIGRKEVPKSASGTASNGKHFFY